MLEARGEARGEVRGEIRGETRLGKLIILLLAEQKFEDIEQAVSDSSRRKELYQVYGI